MPYPVKNARYTVQVPYLDEDGDPTDPTTPDTEISQDGGAFTDAVEEVTTITGANGAGFITLTGAEMNNSAVFISFKVASGPKATLMTLYPRLLPVLENGTAQAGAAGSITLASGAAAYNLTGCIVRTTGGTGGGGTGGANNQARIITAYNTSTKEATVAPNWEVTPDSTTTYDVLITDIAVNAVITRALRPTTDGRTLDVSAGGEGGVDWANVGSPSTVVGLSGTTVKTATDVETDTADIQGRLPTTLVSGRIDASVGAMAASVLTAAAIAADAFTAAKFASDVTTELRSLVSGTSDSGTTTTMVDAARTEADTDYWKGAFILFTSGAISGQCRLITAFDAATDTITFAPATTQAVAMQTYEILPSGRADVQFWLGALINALISGRVDANAQVVGDKTGYSLTQTFPSNFSSLSITAGGLVDITQSAADKVWETLTSALTAAGSIGKLLVDNINAAITTRATPAQVNTEVLDVLNTDTFAEPGQEAPAASATLATKIGYLYKSWRNRATQTSDTYRLYGDNATTVDQKATVSADGTTFDKGEVGTGP